MQEETTRQNDQPKTWFQKLADAIVFKDEPFAAILFGKWLGWMYHPFFLWLAFCRFDGDFDKIFDPLVLLLTLVAYTLLIQYLAIYDLLRWRTLHTWKRRLNVIIFYLFGNLSLIWLSFGRKRRLPLLCFAMAFMMTCLYVLSCVKFGIALYPYNSIIYTLQYVFSAIGLILLNERISRKVIVSAIPVFLGLYFLFQVRSQNMKLHQEREQIREKMTALLHHPANQQGLKEKLENGLSIENEPLKTLIKCDGIELPELDAASGQAEYKQAWAEFTEQHGAYIQAVNETAKLPPQSISHESRELFYEIPLPELQRFRKAARYLALEIKANADNKETIASCNQKLIQLRNWPLASSPLLMSKIVAIAIESIRFDAIGYTLGHVRYTQKEWEELLGEMPDWNAHCACGFAYEALFHENMHDYLLKNAHEMNMILSGESPNIWHFHGVSRLVWSCFLDRDLLMGWHYTADIIQFALSKKHDFKELELYTDNFEKDARRRFAITSMMLMPAVSQSIKKHDQIKDYRTMAMLGWQVMEYRHAHGGELPESLEALGEVPVNSINGLPFAYEHGDMEIKKTQYDDNTLKVRGFRIMPDKEDNIIGTSFIVPLE